MATKPKLVSWFFIFIDLYLHMQRRQTLLTELRQLFYYIQPKRRRQLALLLLLMLLSAFSEVASLSSTAPFLGALSNSTIILEESKIKPFFDFIGISTESEVVRFLALLFIILILITNFLRVATLSVQTQLAARISSEISRTVFKNTLLQPYDFHVKHSSSDLITLVVNDTGALTGAILIPFLAIATNFFVAIGLLAGLFIISSKIALLSIITFGSTYLLIYRWRSSKLLENSRLSTFHYQRQVRTVQESLGGIRDVILSENEDFFERIYGHSTYIARQAYASNVVTSVTPRYFMETLCLVSIALLAMGLENNGNFNEVIPILGALALGVNRLLPVLQSSFASMASIQGNRTSLQRVLIGLSRTSEASLYAHKNEQLSLKEKLIFRRVWFHYLPEDKWILKDVDLVIHAKTTVGFVGVTGSGKSTAADLILGLLRPSKGSIFVDGQTLTGAAVKAWQKSIAHVPQSIFLSDGTIEENIAFGIPDEEIEPEKVKRAACLAQLDEFINSLPRNYQTVVGERGVRLSGGQQQRIGIARALYREASTIIFDEATSALDNTTEAEVMSAISSLSKELTIILIAHRLDTLKRCDTIFEFVNGDVHNRSNTSEIRYQ